MTKKLERVIASNWERIDETITPILQDIGRPLKGRSALSKVDPYTDMYGSGEWGYAYPTAYKNWTLKISADPNEGPLNSAVLHTGLRESPACAYVLGLWRLKEKAIRHHRQRTVWVILRENIIPISVEGRIPMWVDQAIDDLHIIRNLSARANELEDEMEFKGYSDARAQKAAKVAGAWERKVVKLHEAQPDLAELMLDFYEIFGARLADLHGGNVGLRQHSLRWVSPEHTPDRRRLVAFDLGNSDIDTKQKKVPLLPNPDVEAL